MIKFVRPVGNDDGSPLKRKEQQARASKSMRKKGEEEEREQGRQQENTCPEFAEVSLFFYLSLSLVLLRLRLQLCSSCFPLFFFPPSFLPSLFYCVRAFEDETKRKKRACVYQYFLLFFIFFIFFCFLFRRFVGSTVDGLGPTNRRAGGLAVRDGCWKRAHT